MLSGGRKILSAAAWAKERQTECVTYTYRQLNQIFKRTRPKEIVLRKYVAKKIEEEKWNLIFTVHILSSVHILFIIFYAFKFIYNQIYIDLYSYVILDIMTIAKICP